MRVLERRRTKKWRKVKETEKQKIIPALDETSRSNNTEILIPQKSPGSIRVKKNRIESTVRNLYAMTK